MVANTSTRTADHVRACDRLPLGLSYARLRGARLHDGRACWTIATLAPHTAKTRRGAADAGADAGDGVAARVDTGRC